MKPLPYGIELREVDRFAEPEFTRLAAAILGEPASTAPGPEPAPAAVQRLRSHPRPWSLRIGAFQDDRLAGWTHGWQDGPDSFLMATSGVVPELRRQGINTNLVAAVLQRAGEEGFERVRSRHAADNNAVIIAKLGLGFRIAGVELSAELGPLVILTYELRE